jgi:hypothetical protein
VRLALLAAAPALLALATGCGSGEDPQVRDGAPRDATPARHAAAPAPAPPPRVSCPVGAANCRSAVGTILYVERVDPDGDGDAHFVLASGDSVTAPGISVIDVERSLRPHPLPGPGARVSAAGPVYRGSYGQRQIQATELHVAP